MGLFGITGIAETNSITLPRFVVYHPQDTPSPVTYPRESQQRLPIRVKERV